VCTSKVMTYPDDTHHMYARAKMPLANTEV
jgi:hypothetical protein